MTIKHQDFFTEIAQTEIRDSDLRVPNEPIPFEKQVCTLVQTEAHPTKTPQPMDTKEQLYTALQEMRRVYRPFLENHAP